MMVGKFNILSFLVMLAAGSVPASALECPSPQMVTQPGALKETSKTVAERSHVLAVQGESAIPAMIYILRQKFPKSTNAEIVDYLITAYCPALNDKTELSETERKARLMRFGDQVRARLQ
jgi:hypothetical protein